VSEGKPLDVLDEQERFCISMLAVPAVNRRIKALGIRFTAVEKADEARAIFKVTRRGSLKLKTGLHYTPQLQLTVPGEW
jgi:hypothetical protein